jgi:hypothetical protein
MAANLKKLTDHRNSSLCVAQIFDAHSGQIIQGDALTTKKAAGVHQATKGPREQQSGRATVWSAKAWGAGK